MRLAGKAGIVVGAGQTPGKTVWGGGIQAASVAADCGLAQGKGGRVDVQSDLTVADTTGVYAIGDIANIAGVDGQPLPQLGSVALQSGRHAAENLLADFDGTPRKPFTYRDKGIMAMIGRGAAIAEVVVDWAWDGFSKTGGPHVLDRGDAAEIDWDDDDAVTAPASTG